MHAKLPIRRSLPDRTETEEEGSNVLTSSRFPFAGFLPWLPSSSSSSASLLGAESSWPPCPAVEWCLSPVRFTLSGIQAFPLASPSVGGARAKRPKIVGCWYHKFSSNSSFLCLFIPSLPSPGVSIPENICPFVRHRVGTNGMWSRTAEATNRWGLHFAAPRVAHHHHHRLHQSSPIVQLICQWGGCSESNRHGRCWSWIRLSFFFFVFSGFFEEN